MRAPFSGINLASVAVEDDTVADPIGARASAIRRIAKASGVRANCAAPVTSQLTPWRGVSHSGAASQARRSMIGARGKTGHSMVAGNRQRVSMGAAIGRGGHTYPVAENWAPAISFREASEGALIKLSRNI